MNENVTYRWEGDNPRGIGLEAQSGGEKDGGERRLAQWGGEKSEAAQWGGEEQAAAQKYVCSFVHHRETKWL